MRFIRFALLPSLSLVALCVVGCCPTVRITSFIDPDFPNPGYSRIVPYAAVDNFEWRQALEGPIVERLLQRGLTAYRGADVLPPTRKWEPETEMAALRAAKADACLRISVADVSVHESYIPPKTETTVGHETKERKSGEVKKIDTTEVVTTTTTGGYVQRTTITTIKLELIDIATGRVAWIATTDLPALYSDKCSDSFAADLVERLATEKMVR